MLFNFKFNRLIISGNHTYPYIIMLDLYTCAIFMVETPTFHITHNVPYIIDWLDISIFTSLEGVFAHSKFNRKSLLNWDTSRVMNMSKLFFHSRYNQVLIDHICWDIGNLRNASYMFAYSRYNRPLITHICWATHNLMDTSYMFAYSRYNRPLVTHKCWDMQCLRDATSMFEHAKYKHPLVTDVCWFIPNLKNPETIFNNYTPVLPIKK